MDNLANHFVHTVLALAGLAAVVVSIQMCWAIAKPAFSAEPVRIENRQ